MLVLLDRQPLWKHTLPDWPPLLEKIRHNDEESRTLAELRDTLLPKLISGELDVSDIDIELPDDIQDTLDREDTSDDTTVTVPDEVVVDKGKSKKKE